MGTFRHILMLRFTDDATKQQKQALSDGLARMPEVMSFIRRYEFGADLAINEGNPDLALVADFDSEEDWRAYQSHPDHLVLVDDLVKPIVMEAIRVQYLVD